MNEENIYNLEKLKNLILKEKCILNIQLRFDQKICEVDVDIFDIDKNKTFIAESELKSLSKAYTWILSERKKRNSK